MRGRLSWVILHNIWSMLMISYRSCHQGYEGILQSSGEIWIRENGAYQACSGQENDASESRKPRWIDSHLETWSR